MEIPEMNEPNLADPDADWFSQEPTLKKIRSHPVRNYKRRMSYLEQSVASSVLLHQKAIQ